MICQKGPVEARSPPAHRLRDVKESLYFSESAGRLKARKRGQRTIILCADLKHWVESFPRASYGPAQPRLKVEK
jgi:hypothetical protein